MNRVGDNLTCTGTNREVVEALTRAEVSFVIIGGLAISWHCSERQADDMDLLVDPTPENAERIAIALGELKLTGYNKTSFTKLGVQAPLKQRHYAELLTPRKEGPPFSDVARDAVPANVFKIPARVASVATLIRLKESAVASAEAERSRHLRDIELLKGVNAK